ncbi:MAG: hypothetical protein AAFN63_12055 [Pseudomonadota bacterium]
MLYGAKNKKMAEPLTVLHGGFHKTASTFLQKSLQRNRGKLKRSDVHYVPHRELRKNFTVPCQRNAVWEMGLRRPTFVDNDALRKTTTEYFEPLVQDPPQRLILSDENFAGHCGNCVKFGKLYEFRDKFIGTFHRELPFEVHEIYFAVRNYADFFAAAYVEYCRSLQADGPAFVPSRRMCTRVFKHMQGWNGVINVVTKYFPQAHIYIWRFEDFVSDNTMAVGLLQRLVGDDVDVERFDAPRDRGQRQSASAPAMAQLELIGLTEGLSNLAAKRQDIQARYPRNTENGRFDPWLPWERAHLDRLYADDIARLRTNKHVTVLDPQTLQAGRPT